ncbi:pilus assembly protein [Salmonella enterica]|nr:pilus assembly protein [Salmonella enterica]VEA96176.1 Flp pilus assembly protein TadG [Salmonella enterica subsp. houtenae]
MYKFSFFKNNKGVASIEFAITAIVFIFLVLFVAEIARMSYVSSVLDLAVSEAAKDAKNSDGNEGGYNYRDYFYNRLAHGGGKIWSFLAKPEAIRVNLYFSDTVPDMITSGGHQGTSLEKALARYVLTYDYKPMFFFFPSFSSLSEILFTREVIFVQEFERSQFMY